MNFLIFFILLVFSQNVFAGGGNSSNISIPRTSEKIVNINLEFSSGKIEFESDQLKDVLEAEIFFANSNQKPKMTYEVLNDTVGYFRLFPLNKQMSIFDTENFDENLWRVFLTDDLDFNLNLSLGTSEANLDFSNLNLRNVKLENGLGEITIKCKEQMQKPLRKIEVENGVGEINFYDILNTNFEEMYFEGGLGDYVFHFLGKHQGKSAKAEITAGFSELEILLPKGISVEIEEGSSLFTEKEYKNLEKVKSGLFRNTDFNRNDFILYLKIELGFGSFNVKWTEK